MKKKDFLFLLFLFSLILLAIELGVRAVYFQTRSGSLSGLTLALENITKLYIKKFSPVVRETLEKEANFQKKEYQLYNKEGSPLLGELKDRYKENFLIFVEEAKKINAKVIFIYIPSFQPKPSSFSYKDFFQSLSDIAEIEFIDTTPLFKNYSSSVITLEPEDPHLSRFGNQLIATHLATTLQKHINYRSNHRFPADIRPQLFGDLKPNNKTIWELSKPLPFIAQVNSQGLRREKNILFPKAGQRILCIGDSYTFGLYLPLAHTYPHLLEQIIKNTEVINAGIAGYTIEDELSLFQERGKYVEPDIIILQAFDNDLTDQLAFQRNIFSRKRNLFGKIYELSFLEKKFLE